MYHVWHFGAKLLLMSNRKILKVLAVFYHFNRWKYSIPTNCIFFIDSLILRLSLEDHLPFQPPYMYAIEIIKIALLQFKIVIQQMCAISIVMPIYYNISSYLFRALIKNFFSFLGLEWSEFPWISSDSYSKSWFPSWGGYNFKQLLCYSFMFTFKGCIDDRTISNSSWWVLKYLWIYIYFFFMDFTSICLVLSLWNVFCLIILWMFAIVLIKFLQ